VRDLTAKYTEAGHRAAQEFLATPEAKEFFANDV
jgi:hypothetical protein